MQLESVFHTINWCQDPFELDTGAGSSVVGPVDLSTAKNLKPHW
jgi:hypothetical protein